MGPPQYTELTHPAPFSHPVSGLDENHLLYGNAIGLQYVFEDALDPQALAAAINQLITEFPALSGRYNAKTHCVTPRPDKLRLKRQNKTGHSRNYAVMGVSHSDRDVFLDEPNRRDVLKGRVPLSSFTLTTLADGGCILGVAISHVLLDATGFHKVMKRLSQIYSGETPKAAITTHLDVFSFGTSRTKPDILAAVKASGVGKPIPLRGLFGSIVKNMIIKAMDKSRDNRPVIIHLTAGDLSRLKETVLTESGEPWISTNVALCAHFAKTMARLSYGDDAQISVQLGQLLDLRNRYFESDAKAQKDFVGNAILIHIIKDNFPGGIQNTPRGELAKRFKAWTASIDASDVTARLNLLSDALRHGYSNPGLDVKTPMIAMNNQSKLPVYALSFDGAAPLRVMPQDVGDNIMFFPTPSGGLEVYIRDIVNHGNQAKLLTSEWQARIFDF